MDEKSINNNERSQTTQKISFSENEENSVYKIEYEWEAPERISGNHDKKFYLAGSSIALFVVVFSLLTDNILLVIAIIALVILVYALDSVAPPIYKHQLTNKGIVLFSSLYTWKNLSSFWISQRSNNYLMNLEIKKDEYVELIIFPLGDGDIHKIVSYISRFVEYLPESEISNSFIKKLIDGRILTYKEIIDNKASAL